MKIFLGIDGGGTGTRAVLVDASGKILGQGESGPSNYHNIGLPKAAANMRAATEAAWKDAGKKFRPADRAFLGCAGVKSSLDTARITAAAEGADLAPAGEIITQNDIYNALSGGLAGRPGIALIGGTGTNCLGRDAEGKSFMCGGWGWLLDDEGGGFGLALAAMKAAARSSDGRENPTRLLPAILAFLGLSEPSELLARLYAAPWTADELAAMAPIVIRLADEGDKTALRIMESGAKALAALVAGACHALDFPDGPEVVILGGCARSGPPYQTAVEKEIRKLCPSARFTEPSYSTTHGAAINALRASGADPVPDLILPERRKL
jgi:N-acetylglucosamine kinase